jgi:hypothetical protein
MIPISLPLFRPSPSITHKLQKILNRLIQSSNLLIHFVCKPVNRRPHRRLPFILVVRATILHYKGAGGRDLAAQDGTQGGPILCFGGEAVYQRDGGATGAELI